MKKIICLFLSLTVFLLSACGGTQASPEAPAAEAPAVSEPAAGKAPPAGMQSVLPGMETVEQPSQAEELARSLIDQPLQLLTEQIGQPESAEYAPSCLGSGEDGELRYDGFTVYTYREGDTEQIKEVLHGN